MAQKKFKKEILAIIPARGGSKSIPHKNIVPLSGKPLIAWTIAAARKSKFITRTVVSSDDEKILQVGKKYGAETIKRPAEFATDKATSEPIILHVLDYFSRYQKYKPDLIVYLQPTSPLRTSLDIDEAFKTFFQKKADALVSVYEIDKSFLKSFLVDQRGMLKGVSNNRLPFMNRQTLPPIYMPNGAIYILKTAQFKKHKRFFENKTTPFIMPADRSIDLDDKKDLSLIRKILGKEKISN